MDLRELLSDDHAQLDAFLGASLGADGTVDQQSYAAFRRGLLRHIGIEEKILFPAIRQRRGESEVTRQLHRDHAALSALLVPPPDAAIIGEIRAILDRHNPLEEDAQGMYDVVERLVGEGLPEILERVRAYPEVPMARYSDTPILRASIEKLVRDAEAGAQNLTDRRA